MKAANFVSNSRALGPVVSQPDRNTEMAAAISSSPMAGLKHGMLTGPTLGLRTKILDAFLAFARWPGDINERCGRRCCMD